MSDEHQSGDHNSYGPTETSGTGVSFLIFLAIFILPLVVGVAWYVVAFMAGYGETGTAPEQRSEVQELNKTAVAPAHPQPSPTASSERLTPKEQAAGNAIFDMGGMFLGEGEIVACSLHDAEFEDADLEVFEDLFEIHQLILSGTPITDAGLKHVKELTGLRLLMLDHTQVTDAGLVHLRGLTNLTSLHLNHTQITDAGLVHLRELTNLISLDLNHTQITDAGLHHLKELTGLKSISVFDTQVTADGFRDLKAALPGCHIPMSQSETGLSRVLKKMNDDGEMRD